MLPKHKVFISYHHKNDQEAKDKLLELNNLHDIFTDMSVDIGDIDDELSDEQIRQKIRDEYLRDSSVTIVLVGTETKNRKHIDWEIYSSMYNGVKNKKSGILIIQLPSIYTRNFVAAHGDIEKREVYKNISSWTTLTTKKEFKDRFPYIPERIVDNLTKDESKISIANWGELDTEKLKLLIHLTFIDRELCDYDLSRPMQRVNY